MCLGALSGAESGSTWNRSNWAPMKEPLMRVDVGKEAKKAGAVHPKHARKIDYITKKLPGQAKALEPFKRFGYSYEYCFWWRRPPFWRREYWWFGKERSRDQSLERLKRTERAKEYRDFQLEQR